MGAFPLAFLQVCCHIYPGLCAHVLLENILNSNWTSLFRFLLKFACKDQFPSSFSLKLFPMFVGIVLFRHAPKTAGAIIKHRAGLGILSRTQCKVYAFHCFLQVPMSVPPLGILCALPRRFSTASCPPLSPPTKEKDAERGWSRWKGVGGRVGGRDGYGWRGWVKVMLGWCEAGGARVERWWNEGWSVENVTMENVTINWYQIKGYIYCIYSHPFRDPLLGILSFLFSSPQLFLFSPPFHPSTCPSPLNIIIPLPKRMLGAESVERSEQGWKAERVKWSWGDDGRVTMQSWAVGCSERQMDGEKENIH